MINFVGKTLKHLYHAKYGRVLAGLFLLALVVTAGATVYVFFYSNSTATVRSPDVQLIAGPDIGASCSSYPCASGSVSSTHDVLTVSLSMFPATTGSPTPGSYYSNFAQIKNTAGTGTHSIKSIQVFNIVESGTDFGSITVYLCTSQTEFSVTGSLSGCVGSFSISSTTGGSVSGTFPQSLSAGSTDYVEVSAYAASGALVSDTITFQVAVQWV